MSNLKTAISLDEELFERAESVAREMKVSRSRLFAMALAEFIERHQNRRLLDSMNKAYEAEPDATERKYLRKMRRRHWKSIEGQW